MKLLLRIDGVLNRIEGWAVVLLLSVMVTLSFTQVVLRNLFSTGLVWADPFIRHLLLWIAFFGAALATSAERHIAIDALSRFLPKKMRHVASALTNLFAASVCFFLLQASRGFIELEKGGTTSLLDGVPALYFQLIIPIGFGLLLLHFGVRFAVSISRFLEDTAT